jgi:PAS domain S-box-containing protein
VERVLGYDAIDRIGRNVFDHAHPDDVPRMRRLLDELCGAPGAEGAIEARVRHASGMWRSIEGTGKNLLEDPAVRGIVVNYRDATDRNALEEQLRHQAFHDVLTGLANRALLTDRLEHALGSARRHDRGLAVLFIDLDDFKAINDSLGHSAGDALLVAAGQRIVGCLRPGDTAARIGGDEFAILLEDVATRAWLPTLASESSRRCGGRSWSPNGSSISTRASEPRRAPTRRSLPTTCCATRTWRCMSPSVGARIASRYSSTRCTVQRSRA